MPVLAFSLVAVITQSVGPVAWLGGCSAIIYVPLLLARAWAGVWAGMLGWEAGRWAGVCAGRGLGWGLVWEAGLRCPAAAWRAAGLARVGGWEHGSWLGWGLSWG